MKENLHSLIYLAQCDTTTGFLSHNAEILNLCKSRPKEQPLLIESSSLHTLKTLVRVPKKHKNRIRKAKYATFIYPNKKALRLVREGLHSYFLKEFKTLYSTSANPTKEDFNEIKKKKKNHHGRKILMAFDFIDIPLALPHGKAHIPGGYPRLHAELGQPVSKIGFVVHRITVL